MSTAYTPVTVSGTTSVVRRWTIPGELSRVAPLVEAVGAFVEAAGADARTSYRAQVMLEEIVANSVNHGEVSGDIRLAVTLGPQLVQLDIEEEGRPFDPFSEAPEVDVGLGLHERTPGGLGVFLVKRMADAYEYAREGRTNRVRIVLAATGETKAAWPAEAG